MVGRKGGGIGKGKRKKTTRQTGSGMHGRTCFLYRYSRRRRVFLFVDILAKQTSSLPSQQPALIPNFSRAVSALESASALNETILGFPPTSVSFNIVKHNIGKNSENHIGRVIGDW